MTRSQTIKIQNATAMQNFAAKLAKEISALPMGKHARVIALVGNLGAGKTTFTQGFLKALGVKRRVISPTFLIIRPYELSLRKYEKVRTYERAFHIDAYRINKPEELLSLGLRDILNNPTNIVLIEWPELIKKELPKDTKWIEINHPEKGTHRIVKIS